MKLKQRIGAAIVVVFTALALVGLFNKMDFSIEAFEFEIQLELPDHGVTEISIPPLGSISVATHNTPVRLHLTLKNISLDLLGNILENISDQQELVDMFQTKGSYILRFYILRLLLLAFLGGIAGALLLRFTDPLAYLCSGLVGLLTVGMLLVGTYSTYQIEEFRTPQFNGALEAAPWMIGLAEEALSRVRDLSDQMQVMSGNLNNMFERMEAVEPLGIVSGKVKILHVSDIHNNPIALDLIKQIVDNYGVDYIIDTGDLSDYGTSLEGMLTGELAALPVPYIFVPGNHDSPATVEALEKHDNIVVLNEEVVELFGIKVFGMADPASYSNLLMIPSDERFSGHIDQVKKMVSELKPDIVAVHRPSQARSLAGFSPVILHGHDHSHQIQLYKDSILIDAGTTGAAGVRGLQVHQEVPYTMVLLHMDQEHRGWMLSATDTLSFFSRTGKLSLERRLFVH
jgi:predicted phosphodiesterase/uncharacterized membrane protein